MRKSGHRAGGFRRVGTTAAEPVFPFGPAAVGDGCDFAGELHAGVWRDRGVVVSAGGGPRGVVHEDCRDVRLEN